MTAKLYTWICRLHNDLRGQDLVEYALMAGFVAVAGGAIFPDDADARRERDLLEDQHLHRGVRKPRQLGA